MAAENKSSARSGFLPARVVHLHCSKFCNLACLHCYSSSGPNWKEHLPLNQLLEGLEFLRKEGYDVLSLSGGEPLLYKHVEGLLREASALGFSINLISNGAPIQTKTIALIEEYVNLIAISLDGAKETHNALRKDARAFHYVERATQRLKEAGIKFGLSYCVSSLSLEEMPWAWEFAAEVGASLLQFHPFAATGRGSLVPELELCAKDRARAFTIAAVLGGIGDTKVQMDLASVDTARDLEDAYQLLSEKPSDNAQLSDLLNPLIISDTGHVFPFCYGLDESHALAHISQNLEESIKAWKHGGSQPAKGLLRNAFDSLADIEGEYIDWFYHLVKSGNRVSCELK